MFEAVLCTESFCLNTRSLFTQTHSVYPFLTSGNENFIVARVVAHNNIVVVLMEFIISFTRKLVVVSNERRIKDEKEL